MIMRSAAGDMVGCSNQCLLAGAVAIHEAHYRNEVQYASWSRKGFGPRDDTLNEALGQLIFGGSKHLLLHY